MRTLDRTWLEVINHQYYIVYTTGLRKDKFGLLLSFEDGSYAGNGVFVFTQREQFYTMYKDLVTGDSDKFTYIKPMKTNVKYRRLTEKGLLRLPSFVDWA